MNHALPNLSDKRPISHTLRGMHHEPIHNSIYIGIRYLAVDELVVGLTIKFAIGHGNALAMPMYSFGPDGLSSASSWMFGQC